MSRTLEDKLDAAMLAILHEHPFYWTVLQKLERKIISCEQELPGCVVAATDGFSTIVFNREGCEDLTTEVLIGLHIHEGQHVAHMHTMRLGDRQRFRWNVATDYAVNDLIFEDGLQLPEGALYEPTYEGMAPEEIYEQLQQDEEKEQEAQDGARGESGSGEGGGEGGDGGSQEQDQGGKGGGSGDSEPDPGSDGGSDGSGQGETGQEDQGSQGGNEDVRGNEPGTEGSQGGSPGGTGEGRQDGVTPTKMKVDWTHGDMMTDLMDNWQDLPPEEKELHTQKIQALRQRAIMIAQAAGKDLRICEVSEQAAFTPRDWREHLRSFVMNQAKREDYTWQRPNRRFVTQGIYLPSMRGTYDPDSIVLAIDNSGSISQDKLEEFLEEIACIMVEMPTTLFHIICCDTRVNAHHKVTSGDLPLEFEVHARGGTRFTPVFVEVAEEGIEPEALIYFTDMGSSDYPKEKPEYPVLWMNYGKVQPTSETAIRRVIEKAKKEYKQYSWHGSSAWSEQDWRLNRGFPPFGELTNMRTEERRR